MVFEGGLIRIDLAKQKALPGLGIDTDVELVAVRFAGQRIAGQLLNGLMEFLDMFGPDDKFNRDGVHSSSLWHPGGGCQTHRGKPSGR